MTTAQDRLEHHRALEVLYRRVGRFEAAIAMQRAADLIEAGVESPLVGHIDRGSSDGAWAYVDGDLVVINSGDGGVAIAMTRDRVARLFIGLAFFLEVSPDELFDIGLMLEEARKEEQAQ